MRTNRTPQRSAEKATATATETLDSPRFDAVIVGNGTAALSARHALSDAGHLVLMIDDGQERDHVPGISHTSDRIQEDVVRPFPGCLATAAGDLTARRENGEWRVRLNSHQKVTTTAVSVTQRAPYLPPDLPGAAEAWGNRVIPHGHMYGSDNPHGSLGVLTQDIQDVQQAVRPAANRPVTLFLHQMPTIELTTALHAAIQALRVTLVAGRAHHLETDDTTGEHQPMYAVLHNGEKHPVSRLLATPRLTPPHALLRAAEVGTTPARQGTTASTDHDGRTDVPGLWALQVADQNPSAPHDGYRLALALDEEPTVGKIKSSLIRHSFLGQPGEDPNPVRRGLRLRRAGAPRAIRDASRSGRQRSSSLLPLRLPGLPVLPDQRHLEPHGHLHRMRREEPRTPNRTPRSIHAITT